MSKENKTEQMNLQDAIAHCEAMAAKMALSSCKDKSCAREHAQLADWLRELKARRELENRTHVGTSENNNEIERFLRNNHSNGNVTILYACRYIRELLEEVNALREGQRQ